MDKKNIKPKTESEQNLDSQREMMILDSLYSRNEQSPIATSKDYRKQYSDLIIKVKKIFGSIEHLEVVEHPRQFPFTTVFSIADMIILSVTKSVNLILEVMKPEYSHEYLPCHSLNVAFLSCKIGIECGLNYRELTELSVGALLHDIGMIKLNQNNYLHERSLSEEERFKIEEHPIIGWNFFKALKDDFPWLLKVILEEHKRENNQGYPQWVKGELHLYSKIVGLCDSYEALSHARIYRKAFHPSDALKMTIESGKNLFHRTIMKAMIEALSIYPVGSLVQLNNNEIAQVVQAKKKAPMKPVVCVLEEIKNKVVHTTEVIDLSTDATRYITNVIYIDSYKIPNKPKE